jgi:hypothetical protein
MEKTKTMIVPSILIMAMEGAALIVLAALLRYVANEGRELAQTRARASGPETPMAAVERGERGIRTISWSALPAFLLAQILFLCRW